MSVSSSAPSTHTSPSSWGLNDRLASIMESIYAIIAGLGLRYVVDTVSRHDFKIAGTLVGLWEGVILLHFLKKLPKSTDPYLAFAVRLFIDFVVTESVSRLVLVLTWTGMGMILADVAPAIWEDSGLRRVWRRFRRDLYIISESVPTVVFFPPTRTVRFSPSREPSVIAEAEEDEEPNADAHTEARSVESSTSADLTEQDTPADVEPSIRRRLPGYFPGMLSDTESVSSSVLTRDVRLPSTLQRDSERTSRRLSVYPMTTPDHDFASETSSQRNEEDDIKLSSSTSSQSTVTGPADTTRFTDDIRITEDFDTTQLTDIPDEVLEDQKPAETMEKATVKKDEEETSLKPPNVALFLPPTPSDSQPPQRRRLPRDDQPRPPSVSIPQIPDMPEESPADGPSEGWENIQKEDASDAELPWEQVQREDAVDTEQPPPPPPKDWLEMNHLEPFLVATPRNTKDLVGLGGTADEHRYSQPPPYVDHLDNHDDIYEDDPSDTRGLGGVASNPGLADSSIFGDGQRSDEALAAKWLAKDAAERKQQEETAQRRKDEEAEMRRLEEEVDEQKRKDEEAAEQRRKEEEVEKKRLEDEQKRREEEKKRQKEAAEQRREEEERKRLEEAEAERRRKEDEAAEKRRLAELEKARVEREAAEQRREEETRRRLEEAEAERRRKEDEAVEKRRLAELEKARVEREAAEQRRKEEEEAEAERRRKEDEAAEKRRLAELEKARVERAAEQRRMDEEKERLEEEEKQRQEEAETKRKEDEAAEKMRLSELEKEKEAAAEKQRKEQEAEVEKKRQEAAAEQLRKDDEAKKRFDEEEKKRKEEKDEAENQHKEDAAEKRPKEDEAENQRKEDEHQPKEDEQKPKEAPAELHRHEAAEEKSKEQGTAETQRLEEKLQAAPPAETVPIPSTSTLAEAQGADGQQSADAVNEETQVSEEAGNDEQHRMETESVATDLSTIPADVESRLSRILLTKAQIVEIQSHIDRLEALLGGDEEGTSQDLQHAYKVIEKLRKKDQRRKDEVVPLQLGPGLNDGDQHISLDAYGQDDTKTRLLEKLEELLSPEATSLSLTVEFGTKSFKKQQKQAVTEVLDKLKLLDRSTAKGRQTIIDVPPVDFSNWATEYRASITQPDDM